MKDDASLADELKSSFLEKDARAAVVAAVNERRNGPKDDNADGDDDYIDKPMARKVSNKTIAKYVNAIVPDVVRTADQQSERRRETMANPRTHISAAVVIPFSQRGVCSALKFSTDRWQKTATPSADNRHGRDNVIRLAAGSKFKLAARNLNAAHTPRGTKR